MNYLELKDSDEKSGYPCQVKVQIKFTPAFVERYKMDIQTFDNRIGIFGLPESLVKYVDDLETEVCTLESNR